MSIKSLSLLVQSYSKKYCFKLYFQRIILSYKNQYSKIKPYEEKRIGRRRDTKVRATIRGRPCSSLSTPLLNGQKRRLMRAARRGLPEICPDHAKCQRHWKNWQNPMCKNIMNGCHWAHSRAYDFCIAADGLAGMLSSLSELRYVLKLKF